MSLPSFLSNRKAEGVLFEKVGGLTTVIKRGTNGTETAKMGLDIARFLPQEQVSYRLNPSSPFPTTIAASAGAQMDFQLSCEANIHTINSARVDITITAGASDIIVAPSCFWFGVASMSLSSASSQPIWDQQWMDYLGQLLKYEPEEAKRIMSESGFRSVGPFGDIAISQTGIAGSGVISNFSSPLESGPAILAGQSRVFSYYLMDSPLEAVGFSPLYLRGTTASMNMRFVWAANPLYWANAAAQSATISNVQLCLEGCRMQELVRSGVEEYLTSPNVNLSISYARPIRQIETYASLSSSSQTTVQLRNMVGLFSDIVFFISNEGQTTAANGPNSLLQSYSPQADDTSTGVVTPGLYGLAYRVQAFNFLNNGVVVADSIQLSNDQLNQRALCATEEKAYLLNKYESLYIYSFSSNTLRDTHLCPGPIHGTRYLNSVNSIQFNVINSIATPCAVNVSGRLQCELHYSTDSTGRGRCDAVTSA